MSPRNRLRLILLADFVSNPRFTAFTLTTEILLVVWCLWNAFYIMALVTAIGASLDLKALREWVVANRPSRRSR